MLGFEEEFPQDSMAKKVTQKSIVSWKTKFLSRTRGQGIGNSCNFQSTKHSNTPTFDTNMDPIKEADLRRSSFDTNSQETQSAIQTFPKTSRAPRAKGVRFIDRSSIEIKDLRKVSILKSGFHSDQKENISQAQEKQIGDHKIAILKNLTQSKRVNLPGASKRRANELLKVIHELIKAPVLSKSTIVQEIKCFTVHSLDESSDIFDSSIIRKAKLKIRESNQAHLAQVESPCFKYDSMAGFLRTLSESNYDSHSTVHAFEEMLNRYDYPASVRMMMLYMGSQLYQLNSLYDRSESALKLLLLELFKHKVEEYVGVYLMLMVKLKANLLEWEAATHYLMKLLAYSWLYNMEELQNWVYFELSRAYFFMNRIRESEFYQIRSEMNVLEPKSNIYRDLIVKEYRLEIRNIRDNHVPFDLAEKISIAELQKNEPKDASNQQLKLKESIKIQSQIKGIHQDCRIKHMKMKNLMFRISSCGNLSKNEEASECNPLRSGMSSRLFSRKKAFAGNPLLRTHESGLKNLNVYFRNNLKGKSIISRKEPHMYTLQNSPKNIIVLKEMARSILLEMKEIVSINFQ